MIPDWVRPYIGLPWQDKGRDASGVDCWGLLRLVYAEVFKIDLPAHLAGYTTAADAKEVAAVLGANLHPEEWRRVSLSAPGDGLVFRILGEPCHVAVAVGDRMFLHVRPGTDACLERLETPAWRRRYLAAYRHRAMP